MLTCRPLANDLWEVRTDISNARIVRVIFCISFASMFLLHGFIKKTQKTPKAEKELENEQTYWVIF
ncbi:MAG: type II toxin-antitoxin system RelE/ParE family toxin [Thalassospira sp.]|uniref:type II toxin-antitoxin system RelE/ParE family toxin n=1 Tax=Thalassospira sp. TaxID=1912094 RepID=UPI001B148BA4|nr:type II toxin-antitoxin system RelE/ParE family toxin [Thalassospira sp.]MBO6818072.1 type II toxin-antitoxin system RelE/ParE family toxin [Thalassospira sp.]MBO6886707.1 type II toxin-antitoxin system RelE/ParE family toxin [Thalassospira sp.]